MELHRRTLVGVGSMIAVAGCLDQEDADPSPVDDAEPEEEPEPAITIVEGILGEGVDAGGQQLPHVEPPDSIDVTVTIEYENIHEQVEVLAELRDHTDEVLAETSDTYDPDDGTTTITHEIPTDGIDAGEYNVRVTATGGEVSDAFSQAILVLGEEDQAVLAAINSAIEHLEATMAEYREQGDGETITSVTAGTTDYSWGMRDRLDEAHEALDDAVEHGLARHEDSIETVRAEIDLLYDMLLYQRDIVRRYETIDSIIDPHSSYSDFEELPSADDLRGELDTLEADRESIGADAQYSDEYSAKIDQFSTELDDVDILAAAGEDYATAGSTLSAAESGYDEENYAIAFSLAQDAQEELAVVADQLDSVSSRGFQDLATEFQEFIEEDIERAETIETDSVEADD